MLYILGSLLLLKPALNHGFNFTDERVPLFWRIVETPQFNRSSDIRYRRLVDNTGDFPCKKIEANPRYPSVNSVRPQDIGIVGAIGDSLTAGTGAKAKNIFEIFDENRGVSFSTGGEGDWRTYPSLINFFRVFNPNVKGASYGNTRAVMIPFKGEGGGERGLNLSKSGSTAQDLPEMAKMLVKKVRKLPNWKYEWKVFTILIGHNDLCSHSCPNTFNKLGLIPHGDTSPQGYRRNIEQALDILRVNLPRTIILLMAIADVTMLLDLEDRPLECVLANFYECPCLYEKTFGGDRQKVYGLVKAYRKELQYISRDQRFNSQEFAVEYVPTLMGRLPIDMRKGQQTMDLRLLAPDCFHFMSNLHGIVARNLWNNMMQPVGNKSHDYRLSSPIVCPTQRRPYLATKLNSYT